MTPALKHEAFKRAWQDYPSQDNEWYVPERGGFKAGWFAALRWADEQQAAAIRDAVAEEREACANVVMETPIIVPVKYGSAGLGRLIINEVNIRALMADAIRARSKGDAANE